jgi:hypothetical protein
LQERSCPEWLHFASLRNTKGNTDDHVTISLLHRVAIPLVGSGIALFCVVLLLSCSVCAWLTLRYALAPLRAVSDSAAAISPRMVHARRQMRMHCLLY